MYDPRIIKSHRSENLASNVFSKPLNKHEVENNNTEKEVFEGFMWQAVDQPQKLPEVGFKTPPGFIRIKRISQHVKVQHIFI